MRLLEAAALFALLPLASGAAAQTASCVVPDQIPAPETPRQADQSRIIAPVTGYLLALSWSPEFCRTRTESKRHRLQCSGEMGRFGFILHGLWPDAAGRHDPRWCRPVPLPDPATIRANLCVTPSADLLAHEWAKHGSCRFSDAPRYFRAASVMFNAVRFPDMDRLSRRNPTAGDIRRAFAARNPGLPESSVAVVANRRQWFQEVRLCLGENFRPRPCPVEDGGVADKVPVSIWRGQ